MLDFSMFDCQALCDKLYTPTPKAIEFYASGLTARQRLWLGAVRSRKTSAVAREVAYHARGEYPKDWAGYRYNRPVRIMVATVNMQKTRDVLQKYLLEGDKVAVGEVISDEGLVL